MAKVMADGAEAPKMGKLNRFMRTPFVMFKNLSRNLHGSHRNQYLQHAQLPVHPLVCNQYATNTSLGRTNTRQFDGYGAPLKIKVRTFIGSFAPSWFNLRRCREPQTPFKGRHRGTGLKLGEDTASVHMPQLGDPSDQGNPRKQPAKLVITWR
jgi:hypothetical protein